MKLLEAEEVVVRRDRVTYLIAGELAVCHGLLLIDHQTAETTYHTLDPIGKDEKGVIGKGWNYKGDNIGLRIGKDRQSASFNLPEASDERLYQLANETVLKPGSLTIDSLLYTNANLIRFRDGDWSTVTIACDEIQLYTIGYRRLLEIEKEGREPIEIISVAEFLKS